MSTAGDAKITSKKTSNVKKDDSGAAASTNPQQTLQGNGDQAGDKTGDLTRKSVGRDQSELWIRQTPEKRKHDSTILIESPVDPSLLLGRQSKGDNQPKVDTQQSDVSNADSAPPSVPVSQPTENIGTPLSVPGSQPTGVDGVMVPPAASNGTKLAGSAPSPLPPPPPFGTGQVRDPSFAATSQPPGTKTTLSLPSHATDDYDPGNPGGTGARIKDQAATQGLVPGSSKSQAKAKKKPLSGLTSSNARQARQSPSRSESAVVRGRRNAEFSELVGAYWEKSEIMKKQIESTSSQFQVSNSEKNILKLSKHVLTKKMKTLTELYSRITTLGEVPEEKEDFAVLGDSVHSIVAQYYVRYPKATSSAATSITSAELTSSYYSHVSAVAKGEVREIINSNSQEAVAGEDKLQLLEDQKKLIMEKEAASLEEANEEKAAFFQQAATKATQLVKQAAQLNQQAQEEAQDAIGEAEMRNARIEDFKAQVRIEAQNTQRRLDTEITKQKRHNEIVRLQQQEQREQLLEEVVDRALKKKYPVPELENDSAIERFMRDTTPSEQIDLVVMDFPEHPLVNDQANQGSARPFENKIRAEKDTRQDQGTATGLDRHLQDITGASRVGYPQRYQPIDSSTPHASQHVQDTNDGAAPALQLHAPPHGSRPLKIESSAVYDSNTAARSLMVRAGAFGGTVITTTTSTVSTPMTTTPLTVTAGSRTNNPHVVYTPRAGKTMSMTSTQQATGGITAALPPSTNVKVEGYTAYHQGTHAAVLVPPPVSTQPEHFNQNAATRNDARHLYAAEDPRNCPPYPPGPSQEPSSQLRPPPGIHPPPEPSAQYPYYPGLAQDYTNVLPPPSAPYYPPFPSTPHPLRPEAAPFAPASSPYPQGWFNTYPPDTQAQAYRQALPEFPTARPPPPPPHRDVIGQPSSQPHTTSSHDDAMLRRLPIQEPPIFKGDALSYPLWRSAFALLIERQNIPAEEKLLFLQRYTGGPAGEALSGLFYLRDESAFKRALDILDERYGSALLVARSFREKLEAASSVKVGDGEGLRSFADHLDKCLIASDVIGKLEILQDPTFQRRILDKLPPWLIRSWARKVDAVKEEHGRYPTFAELAAFVKREAKIMLDPVFGVTPKAPSQASPLQPSGRQKQVFKTDDQPIGTHNNDTGANKRQQTPIQPSRPASTVRPPHVKGCLHCKMTNHVTPDCLRFRPLTMAQREDFFVKNKLCMSCGLTTYHVAKQCGQRGKCKVCGERHLTLFHPIPSQDQRPRATGRGGNTAPPAAQSPPVTSSVARRTATEREIPARTTMILPVFVSSAQNPEREIKTYALLDTMSELSFVSNEVNQELQAPTTETSLRLNTMTATNHLTPCQKISGLRVRPIDSYNYHTLPDVYTTDQLSATQDSVPTPETARSHRHLTHLANQIHEFQEDCGAGLLLGYDCAAVLMPLEVVQGLPFAVKTVLGWSIVGETPSPATCDSLCTHPKVVVQPTSEPAQTVAFVYRTRVTEATTTDVLRMMERDFVETGSGVRSQDDTKFMNTLTENIKMNDHGHYEMPLPFRTPEPRLPDNRHVAVSRALGLRRQLEKRPEYKDHYVTFMSDVIDKGHAEQVPERESNPPTRWYIPHHGVYNDKKPGKIRVVFDCSVRHQGFCINDELLQGPDLINSLIGVLCRFRKGKIAYTCDIEQMFYQFYVTPPHRDYFRFLWWEAGDITRALVDYRMKVHIFGATSSPGCANFGLKQIAKDYAYIHAEAADFLQRDFYVDDGLYSDDDVEKAAQVLTKAREICEKGQLRLHKIASNSQELLKHFPSTELSGAKKQELGENDTAAPVERTLGLQWNTEEDTFTFSHDFKTKPATRRGILSTVASLYDPLGFISPVVLKGRAILQKVCEDGVDWDNALSDEVVERWRDWLDSLCHLQAIRIPRSFVPAGFSATQLVELHHFSDASDQGYGQCSYIRVVDTVGHIHVSLVMAKARVSPLKRVTVPRLELQAATLSTKIARFLHDELNIPDVKHYFWTDSEIVLAYISNARKRFQVFVANRVSQILQFSTADQWAHVATAQNPADIASRGANVKELSQSMWYKGPDFLWQPQVQHRSRWYQLRGDDMEVHNSRATQPCPSPLANLESRLARFAMLTMLLGSVAVILRFAASKRGEHLSTLESRKLAETRIAICAQKEYFAKPAPLLQNTFKQLDAYKDEEGVLRVGGRLRNSVSTMPHPMLLPRDSHFTMLLVRDIHVALGHAGRTTVINELRVRGYWIVGVRRIVAKTVHECVKCRRFHSRPETQKMADLPEERVNESPPFSYVGMDCFGPFEVKEGRKMLKRYGLMITCLASRAVHIEVLEDMTTDALICAIRRTIAIRGNIRQIRSDRGTNFVGASRELRAEWEKMDKRELTQRLISLDCEWLFNPPAASHQGGVWERQIGSARRILNGLVKKSDGRLTSVSLHTFLYEVAAIINSRPLSVQSLEDPLGPLPLSPNHILTMKSSGILPPPGVFESPDLYLRKQWRKSQLLADDFWSKWRADFLATLQTRRRWLKTQPNVEVGDVVLIVDANLHRSDWRLGLVIDVKPSADGLVRSCRLRVAQLEPAGARQTVIRTTELERPVTKLITLVKVSQNAVE